MLNTEEVTKGHRLNSTSEPGTEDSVTFHDVTVSLPEASVFWKTH